VFNLLPITFTFLAMVRKDIGNQSSPRNKLILLVIFDIKNFRPKAICQPRDYIIMAKCGVFWMPLPIFTVMGNLQYILFRTLIEI